MNITRYKWPVIIAAGLHGALFVSFPSDRLPVLHAKKDTPAYTPIPIVDRDVPVPEDEGSSSKAPGGEPVVSLPDVPAPPELRDLFDVRPVERPAPERRVLDLRDYRGEVGPGTGEGPAFGPPRIPAVGNLDRTPRAMAQPRPNYPYEMQKLGADGSVTVEFIVAVDGHVISAEAVRWSRREFVDAAVNAVLKWRFEPGTLNGRKVPFRMAVPVEFTAAR